MKAAPSIQLPEPLRGGGGFLSRNGAGQEVGCCDLSEICQPHCLSQKGQTGRKRGRKVEGRGHVF